MKTALLVLAVLFSTQAFADKSVRGYVKKDGTYVQPHMKSSPNQFKFDNYSSKGNTNPYTGQKGYERNEFTNPPEFNDPSSNVFNSNTK